MTATPGKPLLAAATAVDIAVEQHVREVIGKRLPGHIVVDEEMGGTSQPQVPCWYVDPVDGTSNLTNGVPWTVSSNRLIDDNGDETIWPESGGILAARPENARALYRPWSLARRAPRQDSHVG